MTEATHAAPAEAPGLAGMRLKIGVMGAATGNFTTDVTDKAHELGRAIAQAGCILITGACPGLPLAAACGAKQVGGSVVGISPGLSLDEHIGKYGSPTDFHDVLIFTGSGLMGREVVNIRTSDIVVIIGGRSGTLGELAISYDEGKLIGILTGTGGITDIVGDILAVCEKNTGAHVAYDPDPARLITKLLEAYSTEHFRRPSCFCSERTIRGQDAAGATRRDPVCGMSVPVSVSAVRRHYCESEYLFCSEACAEHFDRDPERYAGGEVDG
jgi:uncharacterized protein (TIGR00725 family)